MDTSESAPLPEATPRPLSYKIGDAARATGASRRRLYRAIENKKLTARKDGRATLVLADELQAWLKSLPAIGKQPEATAA
jgi:excisionase family DNA binding protein